MGTLWHLWSPVLISLAALFSKGEDAATLGPGTNFAWSACGRVRGCGHRERGRGCALWCVCVVCVCSRAWQAACSVAP